jgi:hypothetical protein
MSQLADQITEAIKKNLPQQIGEELQRELADLAALRSNEIRLQATISSMANSLQESKIKVDGLEAQLVKHASIAAREGAVLTRELHQEFSDLKVQIADERRVEMLALVSTVFRSPVYQHSITGSVPVPVSGAQGGNGYGGSPGFVQQSPISTVTTVTEA